MSVVLIGVFKWKTTWLDFNYGPGLSPKPWTQWSFGFFRARIFSKQVGFELKLTVDYVPLPEQNLKSQQQFFRPNIQDCH